MPIGDLTATRPVPSKLLFGMKYLLAASGLIACLPSWSWACTDVLVTPGASEDGSAMLAYNADSEKLMGFLYHYPPSQGDAGKKRKIYEWDTGAYLGEIDEADETYNVVGNCNEHGLCIGESTFGGVGVLQEQKDAILDYGSLIWVTLQRSKSAREAIKTIESLMDTYGYASEGESFSILDQSGEVWLMDIVGRGNDYDRIGAVWVARRIPDGMVSAHANQARITTFPRNDPDNCMYADDVVDLAVHYGLYSKDADPVDFSFSDVYCPMTFLQARLSEARVWSVFSAIADRDHSFEREYLDYASGRNITHRMPLWIKPHEKLSLRDVIDVMASHYEGTDLDSSQDVGAGLYDSPYRPRPLEWQHKDKTYHIERSIAVPKTGWNFIAQIRHWMPPELSAVLWFGVDDSSTSPRVPVYAGSTRISKAYAGKGVQDGVRAPILDFDLTKAFWVCNMVSNYAYSRWSDIYPVVREKIHRIHEDFEKEVESVDDYAFELYKKNGALAAIEFVTKYGVEAGDSLHEDWMKFYGNLFARFRDFFDITAKKGGQGCACEAKEQGMTDAWKSRIIEETGSHYEVLPPSKEEQKNIDILVRSD